MVHLFGFRIKFFFFLVQICNVGSEDWEDCGELWYWGCSTELKGFGSSNEWSGTHNRAEANKDTGKKCHSHVQDQGRTNTWDCCHTQGKCKHVLFSQLWFFFLNLFIYIIIIIWAAFRVSFNDSFNLEFMDLLVITNQKKNFGILLLAMLNS